MARSFSTLFFKAAKARQDPARGLEPVPPAPPASAPPRSPGGGQAAPMPRATAPRPRWAWAAGRPRASSPTAWAGVSPSPATFRPACRAGMPLVVMLHGCRQTALSFAQGSRMNQWADAAGFMVLYPQQSMARQVQRCWRWFQPDALHGGGEADLIAALVRSEVGRHGLDRTRASAGAGMAALVALRHPQLVAALAMHSGPVTGDAQRRRGPANHAPGRAQARPLLESVANPAALRLGMPAIILQGQLDPAVAPRNARQLFDQFRLLNGLHPRMFRSARTGAGHGQILSPGRHAGTAAPWCGCANHACRACLERRRSGREIPQQGRAGRIGADLALLPGTAARRPWPRPAQAAIVRGSGMVMSRPGAGQGWRGRR